MKIIITLLVLLPLYVIILSCNPSKPTEEGLDARVIGHWECTDTLKWNYYVFNTDSTFAYAIGRYFIVDQNGILKVLFNLSPLGRWRSCGSTLKLSEKNSSIEKTVKYSFADTILLLQINDTLTYSLNKVVTP
ncbi:MAG: hypothetical protein JW795_15615 [Chitinivibrionales bacterium]|nr:hypothetical protein [Chitinivibrionales bacterium]